MENTLNIEKIEEKAQELGLNQANIARKLNVTREAVSRWFKREKFPRPDKLLKLARLLDLTFAELVIKVSSADEPIIAFRKKGTHKIKPDYVLQAQDMGRILSALVPYLPFDTLSQPAILKRPSTEYVYIQKVTRRIREDINVHEGDEIHFSSLIRYFNKLQAVIIPVLWGDKQWHENALHIYLPNSMTTWIYLNLDCRIHDFKFWMAHELGHAHAPTLQGDEGEDFADAFAAALLMPEEMAAREYDALIRMGNVGAQINQIKNTAKRLVVSPFTVYCEINKYANQYGKKKIDLDSGKEIHKATSNFYKQFDLVSENLFGTMTPPAADYIASAEEKFESPFFDILGKYLVEHHKSASFIQSILNIPLLDAQNVYEALQ